MDRIDYDGAYHVLFGYLEMVEQLIRSFVKEPWVEELDFKTLKSVNATFHTEAQERRQSDMFYKIRWKESKGTQKTHEKTDKAKEGFFFICFEFQSSQPKFMAIRIMQYVALFYEQYIRQYPYLEEGDLPPVWPVVVSTDPNPWRRALDVRQCVKVQAWPPGSLSKVGLPWLEYRVIEAHAYRLEDVESWNTLPGYILKLETIPNQPEFHRLVNGLDLCLTKTSNPNLVQAVRLWFFTAFLAGKGLGKYDTDPKDYQHLSIRKMHAMLSETIPTWKRQWFQQGREEGRKEGREEGREEGELRGEVKALLKAKFQQRGLEFWESRLKFAKTSHWQNILDCVEESEILESFIDRVAPFVQSIHKAL